jgi:hypothetical protein
MTEKDLHKQICNHIKEQYPKLIFNTDASGIRLTIGQATQMKKLRSSNGFPDIVIYEGNTQSNALFLEVKKETPYKKDGSLKSNEHLQEQNLMHTKLKEKGFQSCFVWSLDMAIKTIKNYLNT